MNTATQSPCTFLAPAHDAVRVATCLAPVRDAVRAGTCLAPVRAERRRGGVALAVAARVGVVEALVAVALLLRRRRARTPSRRRVLVALHTPLRDAVSA